MDQVFRRDAPISGPADIGAPAQPAPDTVVLILEDEATVAEVVAAAARRCGLMPILLRDAEALFDALDAHPAARIVLDLALPDVDGIEVLRRLGARQCKAGIVIVSGLGDRVLAAAARLADEQGLDLLATLPKPFGLETLTVSLTRTPRAAMIGPRAAPATSAEPICPEALARAMHDGSLGVVFQPKIACRTGELIGFEALAQWRRADGRTVPAEHFVAVAEQSSLIDRLSDHILARALRWFAALPPGLSLAVNLSARSLGDHDLVERVLEACRKARIDPGAVVIEITETAATVDPVASLDILTRLRVRGFRVSIDDFGVGHASVAQLARMPFSELKIDRSFVRFVESHGESRSIVRALTGLGHSLGLVVAAEGVETSAALATLAEIGCDHAQGYHVAPPLDGAAAMAWRAPQARRAGRT